MLCWCIFITLLRVLSVDVWWGLNECLATSNGKSKRENKKSDAKKKQLLSLLSSFIPLCRFGWGKVTSACREPEPVLLQASLQEVAGGSNCQDVRRKRAVSRPDGLPGKTRVNSTEPRPLCTPASISICCPEHTHIQTHTHTPSGTLRLTLSELPWYPFIICTWGLLRALARLPLSPLHLYGGSNY